MRTRAFTLVELLVSVVITGILATLAMASYQGAMDRANMLVDETNQKILALAVKLYATDQDALPGSLSQLRPRDLERAYAMWHESCPALPRAWAAVHEWWGVAVAEAATAVPFYPRYVGDLKTLTCPSDSTPPRMVNGAVTGASYALNPSAAGKSRAWLNDAANEDVLLIYEADDPSVPPEQMVFRHGPAAQPFCAIVGTLSGRSYRESVVTTVGGKVTRQKETHSKSGHPTGSQSGSGGFGGRSTRP